MTEIATAYISVVPEVNKAIQAAYAETAKGGRQLGEALGGGLSAGAGSGLDALKAKVQATAGAVQKATRDMAAAQKAEADATGALRVAAERLNEVRDNGKAKASQLAAAEESLAKAQRNVEAASSKTTASMAAHQSALARAKDATDSFNNAQDGTSKKARAVSDAYASSSKSIGDSAGKVGFFAEHVSGFAVALSKAAAVGVVALGGMAAGGIALGVKTAAGMEQARISFETMLGSAEKAQVFLKKLSDFAAATPFEFPELQTAASSLISAGINADKVIPIMKSLGNATSGMGTGSEGIKRATVALQQMNAAGKITGEDLNQLRDAGIPVYDLLAAATGKSKEAVSELAAKGKLGRKELEQLMAALESGKGLERFNGLMEKQAQSLTGLWSTFKDTLSVGLANAVEPLLPLFKDLLAGASAFATEALPKVAVGLKTVVTVAKGLFDLVIGGDFTGSLSQALGIEEDSPIVDNILRIRETIIGLFDSIKSNLSTVLAFGAAIATIMTSFAIGSALMPLWNAGVTVYGVIAGIAAGETTLWATAQNLLNKAFLNNPIGWILIAIIALVAGVIYAWNNFETFRNVVTAVWEGIQTAVAAVVGWFQDTAWPTLRTVFQWIGDKVTWLWENIFSPVFTVIQAIVGAFAWYIMNIVWPLLQIAFVLIANTVTWLWKNIFEPVFQGIGDVISAWWNVVVKPILLGLKWFFENVLAPVFTWLWHNVIEPFLDGIAQRFRDGVAIIGAIWNGLKALAKIPIDFIVRTVINDGLIRGINEVAGWLKLPIHVDPIAWPPAGWAAGGWTGPGGMYDPAGIVHADEFVVKKKSRRSIESAVPGFLDALNQYGANALGYAGGGRVRPVPGGWTTYSGHTGVDFPVPTGTSVRAFLDGVVESVKAMATSYGTFVMMNHGGGLQSIYAHLQQATVSPGQTVTAGDQVGLSDSTGNSTGPHLHFELRQDGQWFDPSGMLNGTQAIAGGINFQGLKEKVVNFFRDNINSLLDKVPGEGGLFRDVGVAGAKKIIDGVADFLIGKAEATDTNTGTFIAGAGASQWASVALQALALAGQPDSLLPLLLHRIEVESGGNPNAINNWDSNAKAGHPSQGLMQTIPSTFAAYAGALAGRGITDPLANIYAGIMYTNDRYRGNFGRAWSGTAGYAEGGLVEPLLLDAGGIIPKGVSFVENRTGAPEALLRAGGGFPDTVILQVGDREFTGYLRGEIGRPAQMAAAGRRTV